MYDVFNVKMKPNTWYKSPTGQMYYKYYMETMHRGSVDVLLVNLLTKVKEVRRMSLLGISALNPKNYIEAENQETLDLLYEKERS